MSQKFAAPEAAATGARAAAVDGAREKGPSLPVAPYIIVGDTDAHGVTLSAALARALIDAGIPASSVAIHNHFNPKGIATTARGDLIGYIRQLTEAIKTSGLKPTIFIADIPTPIQDPQGYAETLAELASVANTIIYIDTASHGFNAQLPAILAKKGVTNVQFRLGLSVPQTFLPAALIAPSAQIYDLAVIGTVADMDIDAIPELDNIRRLAEEAEEVELPPLTVDMVRQRMHEFVAFDYYLKFGKDWNQYQVPQFQVWGNMAYKVAVLATTPIVEIFRKAQEVANLPTTQEILASTKTVGYVAVVTKKAPKGMVFNYAKIAQAASNTPIIIAYSDGFQPDKLVVVATANAFEKDTFTVAADVIDKTIQAVYEELKSLGISGDQDFPRGAPGAKTLGIDAARVHTAIELLVEKLNHAYRNADKAKYAAELAKNELLALVADEKLASTFASIIEKIVKATIAECRHH